MATNDYIVANAAPSAVRNDLNQVFQAIVSNNSNATGPATTYAYMWWYDTTNDILKMRNKDNDAWVNVAFFNQTNDRFFPYIGTTQVSAFHDQDDMSSNSATAVASQQSIKAYVDNAFNRNLLISWYELPSGTTAETYTSGGWRTLTQNTLNYNSISGASLSSNQFTLPAGTYYIEAFATSFGGDQFKTRLYNVTDATTTLVGSGSRSDGSDPSTVQSVTKGVFTIGATKVFERQIWVTLNSGSNVGFSAPGVPEVHNMTEIRKI